MKQVLTLTCGYPDNDPYTIGCFIYTGEEITEFLYRQANKHRQITSFIVFIASGYDIDDPRVEIKPITFEQQPHGEIITTIFLKVGDEKIKRVMSGFFTSITALYE